MYSKILLIGDPHFKVNNKKETDKFINETYNYLEKNKVDSIIILGDTLHTHEKINIKPFCRAIDFITKLSKYAIIYVLIGNHDRENNKVFLTNEHPFKGLENNKIKIIWKTEKYNDLLFVPYVENGRFNEAIKDINLKEINIIFAHQEFYGAKMKNYTSINGDKWPLENPIIFSGHIHSFQKIQKNIIYTGTPYQLNFGENEDKALLLIEKQGKNINYKRIKLNYVKKITLKYENIDDNFIFDKNNEYRIIINEKQKHFSHKFKDCKIVYNFDKEIIKDNILNINSFKDILKKNIEKNFDIEEKKLYYSII